MPLSDEVREKIVLALTGTTREQCTGKLQIGAARCAIGVVAEAYGVGFIDSDGVILREMSRRRLEMDNDMPAELYAQIVISNDKGATFDEIAKMVKEWEG